MYSLLFSESPIIGTISILIIIVTYYYKKYLFIISIIIFICLLLFYRYEKHTKRYKDNILISPAEGNITYIAQKDEYVHVSIFMSVFNNHTQIYPINGTVIERIYDDTGKFDIVIDRNKSKENEKKIHKISTQYGTVSVTQIAGFIPRRITSSEIVPEVVKAGEYLGMIKFGSRIDISFVGDIKLLKVKNGDDINIGDIIYDFII